METTIHLLGGEVVAVKFTGVVDDGQAEAVSTQMGTALAEKPRIITDLSETSQLSARIIVLLLGVTKKARGRGGACFLIAPKWLSQASQGPSLDLERYGFTLVGSIRQGLDKFGLPSVPDQLPGPEVVTESASVQGEEARVGDAGEGGDEGGLVDELSAALDYWLGGRGGEADKELDDEGLEQVAGGASDSSGLLGELKQGMAYWLRLGKGKGKGD